MFWPQAAFSLLFLSTDLSYTQVLVVWTAEGFFGYFNETWNTLDWIIVALGYLAMTPLGANFGVLRTIRLLRPLRTLKRIESMRRLINSLMGALPGLVNVAVMMFSFVFVMSLFGVKMFKGTMRFHCTPMDDYDGLVERQLMYVDKECEIFASGEIPAWGALAWGTRCDGFTNEDDCLGQSDKSDVEYCSWDADEKECSEQTPELVAGDEICNIGTVPTCMVPCTGTATGAHAGMSCDRDINTDGTDSCLTGCVGGAAPAVVLTTCADPGTVCSAAAGACTGTPGCTGTSGSCTGTATCALAAGGLVSDCDTASGCVYTGVHQPTTAEVAGSTHTPQSAIACAASGNDWWTSAEIAQDFPIREAWTGSCALAVDKLDCRAAGLCEWDAEWVAGADGTACSPATVSLRYVNTTAFTLPKMVSALGLPDRVLAEDHSMYSDGCKYTLACYGYMKPGEMGYDELCDPTCAAGNVCCDKQPRDCPCSCMDDYICDDTGGPNHGYSTFDNIGKASLSIFQIITLEGWTELMDCLTDMSSGVLVTSYFIVLVWVGAFFMTHYLLAMICLEFTKQLKSTQMAGAELDQKIRYNATAGGKVVEVVVSSTSADGAQLWVYDPETLGRMDYNYNAWNITDRGFAITCKDGKLENFECQQADAVVELLEAEAAISFAPWARWIRAIKVCIRTNPETKRAKIQKHIDHEKVHGPSVIKRIKAKIIWFVTLSVFENFINLIIIINFFMLAVDHHGMGLEQMILFENVNLVFTLLFAGEMFAKMFGYGLGRYFDDKFNTFDSFIVTTSLMELAMATESGDGGSFSVLRTLRLLRILRSFKLVKGMDTLKKMIATTAGSMAAIANFGVLLMLLLYIFALVGMQMFGGGLEIEGETARPHFDNLIWSFVSVFLVMTRENWQALLYDTMYASSPLALVYYYALIITTNYILLALFVGTLLENFEKFFLAGGEGDQKEAKEKSDNSKRKKLLEKLSFRKRAPIKTDEDVKDFAAKFKKGLKKPGGGLAGAAGAFGAPAGGAGGAAAAFGAAAKVSPAANKYGAPDAGRNRITSTDKPPEGGVAALQLLADEAPKQSGMKACRAKAKQIVNHDIFEGFVIIAIIFSSGTLAIEHPLDDKHSTKAAILEILDVTFTVFFTFEMVSKIIALGLCAGKDAYMRSGWNILDCFIVVTANLVLITGAEGGFFRIIRTVRVLRPLRAIQRSPGMRAVAGGLFKAVPSIMTVAVLVIFFMIVSAIFCVQMFKGTMWYCSNPDCGPETDGQFCNIDECVGTFIDAESGETGNSEWTNGDWNFDSLGPAMLCLFEIFALEAWPDILLALVDATDVYHGPKANTQTVFAVWLFVIMIMLGAFFLLNLFVGVIVTAYNEVKADDGEEDQETETAARHERMWTKDLVELVAMAEPQKLVYLDFKYRGPFMQLTSARWFEPAVMLIIVMNVAVMGIDTVDEETGQTPDALRQVVEYINIFFTYSFAVEMIVKLISYAPKAYFKEPWNIFDFIITNVSLVEQLFPLPLNPTLVRIFRIFRLARLLRLSKKAKGLKTLMKTFIATLPSLGHVGFLLMIFFFMYAVLGTQLWWNLKRGELVNDYNNFSSFGASLYALFRLSTGENWNGIMHECMLEAPDCHMGYCLINKDNANGLLEERFCLAGTTGEFCEVECSLEGPDCLEVGDNGWDGRWAAAADHPHKLRLDESCAAMGGISDRTTDDGVYKTGGGWRWDGAGTFDQPTSEHVESEWVEMSDAPLTDPSGDFLMGMVYSDCGSSASVTYHITFTIICSLTTLNLIIAVILFAFFDFSESAKKPTLEGDKVAKFEDAWANFDKNAEGELPGSVLRKLILGNGLPLGVKKFADAEDLEQDLWETGLLLDRNGKIQFEELLHAMVMNAFGVNCKEIQDDKDEARRAKKKKVLGIGDSSKIAETPLLKEPGTPTYRDSPELSVGAQRNLDRDINAVGGKSPGGSSAAFASGGGGLALNPAGSANVSVKNIEGQEEPMSPLLPTPDKPLLLGEVHPLSPTTPMPDESLDGSTSLADDSLLPPPVSLPAADVAKAMNGDADTSAAGPGRPQP